jgi:hypothetical protein
MSCLSTIGYWLIVSRLLPKVAPLPVQVALGGRRHRPTSCHRSPFPFSQARLLVVRDCLVYMSGCHSFPIFLGFAGLFKSPVFGEFVLVWALCFVGLAYVHRFCALKSIALPRILCFLRLTSHPLHPGRYRLLIVSPGWVGDYSGWLTVLVSYHFPLKVNINQTLMANIYSTYLLTLLHPCPVTNLWIEPQ